MLLNPLEFDDFLPYIFSKKIIILLSLYRKSLVREKKLMPLKPVEFDGFLTYVFSKKDNYFISLSLKS